MTRVNPKDLQEVIVSGEVQRLESSVVLSQCTSRIGLLSDLTKDRYFAVKKAMA